MLDLGGLVKGFVAVQQYWGTGLSVLSLVQTYKTSSLSWVISN